MSKTNIEAETRACVDSFVADLTEIVKRGTVESVLAAISGSLNAPKAKRGPGRPRKAAPKAAPKAASKASTGGKRGRRSSKAVTKTTEAALAFVTANPGCTVGDIGASVGISTKELRLPLQKLLASGQLTTTGQKRGTRYHAGGAKKRATKKRATKKRATKKRATKKRAGKKRATKKRATSKKK